jgi:hypothetical protein
MANPVRLPRWLHELHGETPLLGNLVLTSGVAALVAAAVVLNLLQRVTELWCLVVVVVVFLVVFGVLFSLKLILDFRVPQSPT